MVKLTTVTAANLAFVKKQPLSAVFVGATNGIGEFTVRELCKTHGHDGPGLRIIIVGRNEKAANQIMTECRYLCSSIESHFVQGGDISLLHSVDKACDEVKSILETTKTNGIDMLVMTQGKVEFGPRIGEARLPPCLLQHTNGSQIQKKASTNRCLCSTTHASASSTACFQACFPPPCQLAPESSRSTQEAWKRKALCTRPTSLWINPTIIPLETAARTQYP